MPRLGPLRTWSATRTRIADLIGPGPRGSRRTSLRVVLDPWVDELWVDELWVTGPPPEASWMSAVAIHVARANLLNVGLEASYLVLTADDGRQIAVDLDEVVRADVHDFLTAMDPSGVSRDVVRRFAPDP